MTTTEAGTFRTLAFKPESHDGVKQCTERTSCQVVTIKPESHRLFIIEPVHCDAETCSVAFKHDH